MKLAKALKQKNKIAGEIARLKSLIKKDISRPAKQGFDFDARELLAELSKNVDELVRVKTGIAVANVEVYKKIFRLAELKGLAMQLSSLDPKEGIFLEGGGYGSAAVEVEYRAQINVAELKKMVEDLENEITRLQDDLDEFNVLKEIAVAA